MIKCHLARLMGERKLRIADVIRETGLSRNTVTLLYKETAQKSGQKPSTSCACYLIVKLVSS